METAGTLGSGSSQSQISGLQVAGSDTVQTKWTAPEEHSRLSSGLHTHARTRAHTRSSCVGIRWTQSHLTQANEQNTHMHPCIDIFLLLFLLFAVCLQSCRDTEVGESKPITLSAFYPLGRLGGLFSVPAPSVQCACSLWAGIVRPACLEGPGPQAGWHCSNNIQPLPEGAYGCKGGRFIILPASLQSKKKKKFLGRIDKLKQKARKSE